MSLDDPFDQVAEFHRCFGHPVADRPKLAKSPQADVLVGLTVAK